MKFNKEENEIFSDQITYNNRQKIHDKFFMELNNH